MHMLLSFPLPQCACRPITPYPKITPHIIFVRSKENNQNEHTKQQKYFSPIPLKKAQLLTPNCSAAAEPVCQNHFKKAPKLRVILHTITIRNTL